MKIYATKTYNAGTEKYSKEFFTFIPEFLDFLGERAPLYSGIRYKDSEFKLNYIDNEYYKEIYFKEITKENIGKYRKRLERVLKRINNITQNKKYFYKNEFIFEYMKEDLVAGINKILNGVD